MAQRSRSGGRLRCLVNLWVLGGLLLGPGLVGLAMAAQPVQPSAGSPAQPKDRATSVASAGAQAGAYTYNPEGRRDPFVSLVTRGFDSGGVRRQGKPAEGVAGMAVAELILKGVFQSRGHYVAIVQGPDNRSYNVRVNDRLFDGFVRAIAPNEIVLIQEVNDPLSVSKQREVRKPLRASSEPK
jgi:Tfp pilus assembly protein PilP